MSYDGENKLHELKRAITRLKEALALPKSDVIRDSVIQRFEFTVELSWKVLQRHLRSSGISEVLTPKNTFREGARLGLINDPEAWIRFVDARNLSSHTYKESLAEEVYASALILPPFADDLVRAIEQAT
jgi:nucleotidyltransferase substrate binding protein (TIGR01987 family)